ncbi:MAG: methyltransferase domain-containing protein [Promethearchaeota archaeon]
MNSNGSFKTNIQYINYHELLELIYLSKIEISEKNHHKIEQKYYIRHLFHNKIISKISYQLSSKKIEAIIFNLIFNILNFKHNKNYKIIDVACGYDSLILKIANLFKNSKIIGNDLCWKGILENKSKNLSNLTLTSENILNSKFWENKAYDLIICKNTLHHLNSEQQEGLIIQMVKFSKNVIIVEIEDPQRDSLLSFVWNFYYRKFLKDDFDNFISKNKLLKMLKKIKSENIQIFTSKIKTVKGNYLIACISKKISNLNDNPKQLIKGD